VLAGRVVRGLDRLLLAARCGGAGGLPASGWGTDVPRELVTGSESNDSAVSAMPPAWLLFLADLVRSDVSE